MKTFNSSDKFSRIPNCNMDIWRFHGGIFFLMSDIVGACGHGHGLDLDILFTDRRTDIGTF